jgi:hypothetical protein
MSLEFYPKFRQVDSPEEVKRVLEAVKADGDNLILPNWIAERHGEIIGAASIGMVPLVMVWNHSQKMTAKDSMHMKLTYDSVMDAKGHRQFWLACNKHSPYSPHMKQLGYKPIWETEIFVGGVKS